MIESTLPLIFLESLMSDIHVGHDARITMLQSIGSTIVAGVLVFLILLTGFSFCIHSALANDAVKPPPAEAAKAAVTAGNPKIPLDNLKLMLKPLTKEELELEAVEWMNLLRAKVKEISQAELFAHRKNKEVEKMQDASDALKDAREKAKEATPEEQAKAAADLEAARQNVREAEAPKAGSEKNEKLQQAPKPAEGGTADAAPAASSKLMMDDSRQKLGEQAEQLIKQKSQVKEQTLLNLTVLRDEQTALADRLLAVIDALAAKGGNVETYAKYIDAVNQVDVDVSDKQALWITVKGWLISKEGGLRWAMDLAKFLGILLLFWGLSHLAAIFANKSLSAIPKISGLMRAFLVNVIHHGTLIVGLLVALTALEISLGPLLALLGGVTFVLAFALQNNLSNFASGLMILFYKPFDVGDEVKLADLWGWVDSITLANTRLKGFSGELITVPNSTVWGDIVTNLTSASQRKMLIPIHINHDQDLARCKILLKEAVASHPRVLQDPAPSSFIWKVSDYYVEIMVGGWTKTPEFWEVYEQVICRVQARLKEEGIGFAIPKQELSFKPPGALPPASQS